MQLVLYMLGMLASVSQILADLERTCTVRDYLSSRRPHNQYALCGTRLADFIIEHCDGTPFIRRSSRRSRRTRSTKTDVFMDGQQANVLLRQKRSVWTGLVCECCIHRCSRIETNQYCLRSRIKRSLGGANSSSQQAPPTLEQIYREIALEANTPAVISQIDFEKIELLENNKRRNIAKKMFNSLTEQGVVQQRQPSDEKEHEQSPTTNSNIKSLGQIIVDSLEAKEGNMHHA